MPAPTIAGNAPQIIELEKGKRMHGAHVAIPKVNPFVTDRISGQTLHRFVFKAEGVKVALCMCKRTNGSPFCDGSHANL